jgi:hypothetical protein
MTGFQGRLLDCNLEAVEETFALTLAPNLPTPVSSVQSHTADDDLQRLPHQRPFGFPSLSIDGYSRALQAKHWLR